MVRDQFSFDPDQAEVAEKALETLEQKLIKALDAHRLGIIIFDARGGLVSCNRQWERLYECDFSLIRDYNILEDQNLQTKHIWEPIRQSFLGVPGRVEENYFTPEEWGKPGRPRWTEGNCLPLIERGNTEQIIGSVIFLNDITDKKITTSELEKLRSFLTEIKTQQERISRHLSDILEANVSDLRKQAVANPVRKRRPLTKMPFIPRQEHNVFEKLAAGYSVKETAHILGLGIKSVYTYRARLLKRLNLTGDVELALAWRDFHRDEERYSVLDTDIDRGNPS